MNSVCVYGDGPVAVDIARQRLVAGDEVALLCRASDSFALLVNEFGDYFLPIEFGNPGNVSLEQAKELIVASYGPIHELVIVVPPEAGDATPAEIVTAAEAFTAHLRETSGALVLVDERAASVSDTCEGRRFVARLGDNEPNIVTVVTPAA